MGIRQPGMHRPHRQLDREGGEETKPQPSLHRRVKGVFHYDGDVGGAGLVVHVQNRHQHKHRAQKRVEEELEAGVNAPGPAPNANDKEHRD